MNFVEKEIEYKMLKPTTLVRSVSSQSSWQRSGIQYEEGEDVVIEWDRRSLWNGNNDVVHESKLHGPAGPKVHAYPGGSNYPLPGVVEDSLIGEIGGEVFFIGEGVRMKAPKSGELRMTINDVGYHDNMGTINVYVLIV